MFWKMKGRPEWSRKSGLEEWVDSVVRVMRASERLMVVELILEDELVPFVSIRIWRVSWLHVYQCMLPRFSATGKEGQVL